MLSCPCLAGLDRRWTQRGLHFIRFSTSQKLRCSALYIVAIFDTVPIQPKTGNIWATICNIGGKMLTYLCNTSSGSSLPRLTWPRSPRTPPCGGGSSARSGTSTRSSRSPEPPLLLPLRRLSNSMFGNARAVFGYCSSSRKESTQMFHRVRLRTRLNNISPKLRGARSRLYRRKQASTFSLSQKRKETQESARN